MTLNDELKPTDDIRRLNWLKYFRRLADLYGLKDWSIEMGNDEPRDYALASVTCTTGRKIAWIRISQLFMEETINEQRMMAVHELTHCHEHMSYSFAKDNIKEDLKPIYQNLMEYTTDAIAVAIAPFFPLPTDEERGCIS